MHKKIHSGMMLTLLLISVLSLGFTIQSAKGEWTGTAYIRADGSIDPPTAPIDRDGDLYTLTGNITSDADGIVVERDHIVIDGAGYTIRGPASYPSEGIDLSGRTNVTVRNTHIKSFYCGIYLWSSSNYNSITGNSITNNGDGIELWESSNNSISGNNITNNSYDGILLGDSSNNNSISGNSVTTNYYGINLYSSSNNSISGNNITNNSNGIRIYRSSHNWVTDNNFTGNKWDGIWLHRSSNNTVVANNLMNNGFGIDLLLSSNNIVAVNSLVNNGFGISLSHSSGNTIEGNDLTVNSEAGIELYMSSQISSTITTSLVTQLTSVLRCAIRLSGMAVILRVGTIGAISITVTVLTITVVQIKTFWVVMESLILHTS